MMQIIEEFFLDRSDHIGQVVFLDLSSYFIHDHLNIDYFWLYWIADLQLEVLLFLFIKIFIVLLAHNVRSRHSVQVF